MKKIGDMTVNDGNGLLDNEGLCDSLVIDCNMAVKMLATGEYIAFCGVIVQMKQKLDNLKRGIRSDISSKNEIIEELKRMNNNLSDQLNCSSAGKEGASE